MHASQRLAPIALLTLAFAALGSTACRDEAAEKKVLADLQRQTDERMSKIQNEAREKVAAAEKQIETLKSDLATATAKLKEADDAVSKAQAGAEEQAKAAEAALKKARQAFKDEGRVKLAALNKEVAEVSQKSAKAPAKVKTEVSKLMQKVVTQQKAIAKDLSGFDNATIDELKKVKAKLEQDLALMKQTVNVARAKVS